MALVREPTLYDSFDCEVSSFDALGYHSSLLEEGDAAAAAALLGSYSAGFSSILADPCNESGGANLAFVHENWANASSSVLSFDLGEPVAAQDQEEQCDAWIDAMDQNCGPTTVDSRFAQYQTGVDMANCFSLMKRAVNNNDASGEGRFGLLYPSTSSIDGVQASTGRGKASQKRPHVASELQTTPKKQCGINRKTKSKTPTTPPKDPQSLAAKNRRERISERLKILQELVPNGTKVDLVTMLEKAISYVKFLQLQVKVLATDEFWPAQGGKAPEISQVKEALDAILSSQRTQSN